MKKIFKAQQYRWEETVIELVIRFLISLFICLFLPLIVVIYKYLTL